MISPETVFVKGFETALNRYLRLDPEALERLACLSGKVIAIEVRGPQVTLYVVPEATRVRVFAEHGGDSDVTIRATPVAFAQLARGGTAMAGEIEVEGDAQLGETFQQILTGVDIDWEEQLSQVVGDVVARPLANVARFCFTWGQRSVDVLLRDIAEFLQHESRDLPSRLAVEQFLDAVDRLRSDTDRLEARIQRLRGAADRGKT